MIVKLDTKIRPPLWVTAQKRAARLFDLILEHDIYIDATNPIKLKLPLYHRARTRIEALDFRIVKGIFKYWEKCLKEFSIEENKKEFGEMFGKFSNQQGTMQEHLLSFPEYFHLITEKKYPSLWLLLKDAQAKKEKRMQQKKLVD